MKKTYSNFLGNNYLFLLQMVLFSVLFMPKSSFAKDRDDACSYVVHMTKNVAPTGIGGWEGAYIRFANEAGDIFGDVTLADGASGSETVLIPNGENVVCTWFEGLGDFWIGFQIADPTGAIIYECTFIPGCMADPDFFTFTSTCSSLTPESPVDFILEGSSNSLEAMLSWTNPSLNISGEPTELTAITIYRDGDLVNTITNPMTGQMETWTDSDVPMPGIYTYSVFAINEHGSSVGAMATDTIGIIRYLPYSGVEAITSCHAKIISEGDPTTGLYFGQYNGMITIYPDCEDCLVAISGTHYIYNGAMGGDPDTLYVYDGVGVSGTLLHAYTNSCFDRGVLNDQSLSGPLTLFFKANGMGGCRGFELYTSCVPVTSLDETNHGIEVFPNPTNSKLTIKGDQIEAVYVYNLFGEMIDLFRVVDMQEINTEAYSNGVYFLRIMTSEGQPIVKKVVVKH